MLGAFAKHGLFDLNAVTASGDLEIVMIIIRLKTSAITVGQALTEALGNKSGINRYGEAIVPAWTRHCVAWFYRSFRRFSRVRGSNQAWQKIGNSQSNLVEHFWRSFADG